MVDYVKVLGSQEGSRMMIRDLGTTVEFWVKSGSPYTYHYQMPFGWTVNGSTGSGTIAYNYPWVNPGSSGPWVKCKSFTVNESQTVTFRIGSTGTTGLNGPTSFSQYIERSSARVKVSGTWRKAIPYVKVNGTWRKARAWVKVSGTWRLSK